MAGDTFDGACKACADKKRTALVLGASSDMLFAVGTFIIGLKKTNPHFADDIIVFYDIMPNETRRKFETFGNVILKHYECPFAADIADNYFASKLYTDMVYSKYECFGLLEEYDTVVWMDYDMYLLGDVSELTVPTETGVKAIVTARIGDSLVKAIPGVDSDRTDGIHSSVFVVDRNLKNAREIYEYCIKTTSSVKEYVMCPEQAVMALAFKHFGTAVYPLDARVYSNLCDGNHLYDRYIKIYHTYGKKKFWNGIDFEPWKICRAEWESL